MIGTSGWIALLHHSAVWPDALWYLAGLVPAFVLNVLNNKVKTMGFDIGSLTIDQSVSREGVWVDFYGGSRLKIRSTSSQQYKAEMAKLVQSHRLQLDASNPDHTRYFQEIDAEALSRVVLVDWSGIDYTDPTTGQTTVNVPYTKELGKYLLLNSDKFRSFVSDKASTEALFQRTVVEEAVGNSPGA